jgi:hypothetical protein
MKELGNTPADKDYKPSGISKEEQLCSACCLYYGKTPDQCGYTDRKMQWDCPYFDFIQRGYEQAEKDFNREMLDRMNEIREKQTKAALEDLNYTIKIEPALGFDEGSAVVYHGKEIISILTWEDIKTIEQIIATSDWYDFEINGKLWSKEFYEEVLKRFNKSKEAKK